MSQEHKGVKFDRHAFSGKAKPSGGPKTVQSRARWQRLSTYMLGFTLLLSACGTEAPTSTPLPPAPATATTGTTSAATTAPATSAPAGDQVVNMLWTDNNNLRQPLIADFTAATGIKVNQVQVQYNALLDKINTSVQGSSDTDVIEMDTIWTAQFASAGWIEDLSDRI